MFSRHEGGKNLPRLMDQVFDGSYAPLSELILGYKRYRTLIWALESGIADILDQNGPMEENDLLARIGISSDYGSIWIEALLGIQILVKNEGLLSINPLLRSYLVTESPLYQGDSLRSISQGFWSHDFSVLDGEGVMHVRNPGGMTPDFLRVVYQRSMRGEIQEISRILSVRHDFQQARHMLDIGGGHGMYTISFCQQNPSLSAVILDKPEIAPFTETMVERYGMKPRVQVVPGDMNQTLPGSGYNMVFFSHVLYKKENLHNLLCRAVELLNPGGLFVTNHKFSEDWVFSPDPLIALENASIHRHHQMMPEAEYRIMLESVRVSAIQSWKIPATTGYTTLHVATKK